GEGERSSDDDDGERAQGLAEAAHGVSPGRKVVYSNVTVWVGSALGTWVLRAAADHEDVAVSVPLVTGLGAVTVAVFEWVQRVGRAGPRGGALVRGRDLVRLDRRGPEDAPRRDRELELVREAAVALREGVDPDRDRDRSPGVDVAVVQGGCRRGREREGESAGVASRLAGDRCVARRVHHGGGRADAEHRHTDGHAARHRLLVAPQ